MSLMYKAPYPVAEFRFFAPHQRIAREKFEKIMQAEEIRVSLRLAEIDDGVFVDGSNLLVGNV
jgi:hypothetical protein